MNEKERFLAVVNFTKPDYYPIFGFPGAPGMAGGALVTTHQRLVDQGMPSWVGGAYVDWECRDVESWCKYWGTNVPIGLDFGLATSCKGIKSTIRREGDFEIIEYESGAIERQVVNNANVYSMPEFIRYSVRDRASWEFWRDRMTPTSVMSRKEMNERCKKYDSRTRPLHIGVGGGYSFLRGLWGPEGISYAIYDDPELIHEMSHWHMHYVKEYIFPLAERLKPEILTMGEDLCYNHGMLISPEKFKEFCGPFYTMVCDFARANDIPVVAVDSDGNVMEFIDIAEPYGVNCLYPFEVKAGNDLFVVRNKHPRFLMVGGLEKEVINEGNDHMIAKEIMSKVPYLLKKGGYFPNGDHGIQPLVTFENLCRFMTVLHEVCDNPEGQFPRMK